MKTIMHQLGACPARLSRLARARRALLGLVIGLALSKPVSAQVIEAWEARYFSPADGNSRAYALALDGPTNIIVTGGSYGASGDAEFTTVKYDSNSNQLWEVRYAGPGLGENVAQAVAVDTAHYVYVTGRSWGTSNNFDYATVKYDPKGNQVWAVRYDGPGHGDDYARAIVVDRDGNVYVNGYSSGTNGNYDYATIKYDANGKELWVARYDGPGHGDDYTYRMAVDLAGNVYVSGSAYGGPSTYDDITTVKYDAGGHQLWVARYDGPGHYNDGSFVDIAVDQQGNVIVAGDVNADSSDDYSRQYAYDYATLKYDSDGKLLWAAHYDDPVQDDDRPQAVAVDAKGNVYVTGASWEGDYDFLTVKYDAGGHQLWASGRDFGQWDFPQAIALDSAGNVYVTGAASFGVFAGFDYATVKYDANGNQIWADSPPGYGCSPFDFGNPNDIAWAVAVNDAGDVYVTGESGDCLFYGSPGSYTTIKYSQTNVPGLPAITSSPLSQTVLPHSTVTLNVAATGAAPLQYEWLYNDWRRLPETNATLVLTNVHIYDSGDYSVLVENDLGYVISPEARLTVLPAPDIYLQPDSRDVVVGAQTSFTVGSYGYPLFYQWRLNGVDLPGATSFTLNLNNIQVAQAGDYTVVITNSYGSVTSLVARLMVSADLRQAWQGRYNGPDNNDEDVFAMKVDNAGNAYVTGYSYSDSGFDDYLTVKYGPTGTRHWTARYDGPAHNTDDAEALAVDGAGNVYVTGFSYGGDTNDFDIATIKYNPGGARVWVARYDGPAHGEDGGTALTVDTAGNVYVTGASYGGAANAFDYVTVKYDTNGTRLWSSRYNGPGNGWDVAEAIAVDNGGNVYVTGYSYGGVGVTNDYATIKYGPNGVRLWVARYNGPGNGIDNAYAIALDSAGNPCVTGRSYGGTNTGSDYATIKYNSTNGTPLWVARYNGPGNNTDVAFDVKLDSDDNVYVTGASYGGPATGFDSATVKYDKDGNQLWVARYDAPSHGYDQTTSIALDNVGNVYVTGFSYGGASTNDYITIKYGPDGNQLWAARFDGPAHLNDQAFYLALDPAANVYVTGRSQSANGYHDYLTLKYVQNNRPTVIITSPTNLSTIFLPANLLITVDSSDSDGHVAKVEFFNRTNKLGEATAPPFSFVWTNPAAGMAILTARAWDDIGADTTSKPVLVTLDHSPVALAKVSPLVFLTPGELTGEVVSANNVNAIVVLDGSLSTDTDGDPVQYAWFDAGSAVPFSTAARVTHRFDIGTHEISLHVFDGAGSGADKKQVKVITAAAAVEEVSALVKASGLKQKQPLLASLEASAASFKQGHFGSGENQLGAFQNKVRSQVAKSDPALADLLIGDAQQILDALGIQGSLTLDVASDTARHGQGLRLTSSATPRSSGGITFTFVGEAGRNYAIQASTDFVNWITLTNFVGVAGTNEFNDLAAPSFSQRFYRVVTQ